MKLSIILYFYYGDFTYVRSPEASSEALTSFLSLRSCLRIERTMHFTHFKFITHWYLLYLDLRLIALMDLSLLGETEERPNVVSFRQASLTFQT